MDPLYILFRYHIFLCEESRIVSFWSFMNQQMDNRLISWQEGLNASSVCSPKDSLSSFFMKINLVYPNKSPWRKLFKQTAPIILSFSMKESKQMDSEQSKSQKLCRRNSMKHRKTTWFAKFRTVLEMSSFSTW